MTTSKKGYVEEDWVCKDRFIFSKREILNSPSRSAGISEEEENCQRIEAALFIKLLVKAFLPSNKLVRNFYFKYIY